MKWPKMPSTGIDEVDVEMYGLSIGMGDSSSLSQPGPLGLFAAPEARRHRPRVPLTQADLIR